MSQTLSLQQVTESLVRLEQLLNTIQGELAELRQQMGDAVPSPTTKAHSTMAFFWVDKALQRQRMNELFQSLAIQAESIGPEALQVRMSQAGLADNELSQSLIEAREE